MRVPDKSLERTVTDKVPVTKNWRANAQLKN